MPEGVGNISTFTNNSDAPITIRPEAKVGEAYNDLHDVEVPSGATYFGYKCDSPNDAEYNSQLITGIDAVWDPVKQKMV